MLSFFCSPVGGQEEGKGWEQGGGNISLLLLPGGLIPEPSKGAPQEGHPWERACEQPSVQGEDLNWGYKETGQATRSCIPMPFMHMEVSQDHAGADAVLGLCTHLPHTFQTIGTENPSGAQGPRPFIG